MKRSKLFLGAAAVVLAAAGIAATKKHQADVTGYYAIGAGHCDNIGIACTSSGTAQCTITVNPGLPSQTTYELFTEVAAGSCVNKVFKDAD